MIQLGCSKISLKRISFALGLVLALLLAVGVFVHFRSQAALNQLLQSPQAGARIIIAAVQAWQAEKQGCPAAQELEEAKLLDPFYVTDGWGSRYLIECAKEQIKVRSLGPDRQLDTPDDVIVSKRK